MQLNPEIILNWKNNKKQILNLRGNAINYFTQTNCFCFFIEQYSTIMLSCNKQLTKRYRKLLEKKTEKK